MGMLNIYFYLTNIVRKISIVSQWKHKIWFSDPNSGLLENRDPLSRLGLFLPACPQNSSHTETLVLQFGIEMFSNMPFGYPFQEKCN